MSMFALFCQTHQSSFQQNRLLASFVWNSVIRNWAEGISTESPSCSDSAKWCSWSSRHHEEYPLESGSCGLEYLLASSLNIRCFTLCHGASIQQAKKVERAHRVLAWKRDGNAFLCVCKTIRAGVKVCSARRHPFLFFAEGFVFGHACLKSNFIENHAHLCFLSEAKDDLSIIKWSVSGKANQRRTKRDGLHEDSKCLFSERSGEYQSATRVSKFNRRSHNSCV